MQKAMFYDVLEGNNVKCMLCSHQCIISPGKRGICHVRENKDGILYSLNYQKLIASQVDPIEKKPLFHFYPGSYSYSIAAFGCNFQCMHCQNWSISQIKDDKDPIVGSKTTPEKVIQNAFKNGCLSISYTYTEPTIFYETAFEISQLANEKGLKNIFITNGYISQKALQKIAPFLDAANVDLKAMNEEFYNNICRAKLQPVLNSIKLYYNLGIWIEITTLIIPGYNDDPLELKKIAEFIAGIDPGIPWHVTAFYPTYKLNKLPITPLSTLDLAYKIGKDQGLQFVYKGNISRGENTHCPGCGELLIKRDCFNIQNILVNNKCPSCGEKIAGRGL
ncbi:MAG: AmmeMemoRadiSam system radical SAM enzyme [Atribacterota bacterium]|nr:AmmeMemoRadiSam system radical SAM enzyme [Atribacterota bacterium]